MTGDNIIHYTAKESRRVDIVWWGSAIMITIDKVKKVLEGILTDKGNA
ncbi:MAG: hypothetical protein ACMUIA_09100 [bacterium]